MIIIIITIIIILVSLLSSMITIRLIVNSHYYNRFNHHPAAGHLRTASHRHSGPQKVAGRRAAAAGSAMTYSQGCHGTSPWKIPW